MARPFLRDRCNNHILKFGGGRPPDGLKRAASMADGWMGAGSTTTEQFRGHVVTLREHLAKLHRQTFAISKRVYVVLDPDEKRAQSRLRCWFKERYDDPEMADRVLVWGNAQRCVEGLGDVVEAGAGMLVLNPVVEHMHHLEALMEDVIPSLPAAPTYSSRTVGSVWCR